MQPGKAFLAGVLGGAAMTLITGLGRALAIQINIEMWIGSLLTADTGLLTWIVGFLIHLGISGVVGLVYGAAFEHLVRGAGAGPGMVLSSMHLLASGIAIGAIHHAHPLIPEVIPHPGGFVFHLGGFAVVTFVFSHVVFGAVVGAVYQPILLENQPGVRAKA